MRKRKSFLSKPATAYEDKLIRKADELRTAVLWGLFLFVAIPLPGTGAWTGALIGSLLNIRLKWLLPAILAGVVTAGVIMCIISYGAGALIGIV